MTLIEVLTGLVILGTVLASLTIARGRFQRQWGDADRKLAATKALDALITEWMEVPGQAVPFRAQGPLPGTRDCVWRTQTLRDADAAKLSTVIVRVEALQRVAGTKDRYSSSPVAFVDLLVHVRSAQEQYSQPQQRAEPE